MHPEVSKVGAARVSGDERKRDNALGKQEAFLKSTGLAPNQLAQGRTEVEGREESALTGDLVTNVALRRLNTAENVANSVAFLASDAASNVTRQCLSIDGGILWD